MFLHQNQEAFKQIMAEVASESGLREDQIEKDYFVSVFLKELLNTSDLPIVFKGGTSLSKVYRVIDRFSEDLDLAVQFEGNRLGDGKRKKLKHQLIETAKSLSMDVVNIDKIESDRDYNFYQIVYDKNVSQNSAMLPYLLIETILSYQPFPVEEMYVSNYITKYLTQNNQTEIINCYHLQPFKARVQTMERTLIDKIFALCDYHIDKTYDRYSRHLYDIHMIWHSNLLRRDKIPDLIEPIVRDRQLYGRKNHSCKPEAKPNNILQEIIDLRAYKKDYEEVTSDFVTTSVAYETCINSLIEIMEMNYLPQTIKVFIE